MMYRLNSGTNPKFKLKYGIFVVITCMLLIIGVFKYMDVWRKSSSSHRNMFYVQLINYTMPVVEETSFDDEDMLENQFTLKKIALNMLGISYNNPIRLVNRELSCMIENNTSDIEVAKVSNKKDDNSQKISGFSLNDKDVAKVSKEETKDAGNNNGKTSNVNVYDPNLKQTSNGAKPRVFIYHTHTCESYRPSKATNPDPKTSVCAVGDVLQNELQQKYGISVIHDKTIHDAYAYAKSYSRSAVTVDKYIKNYGGFDMVIDMHRDSVQNKSAVTTQINGQNVAKFMFVMSRNNPHFSKNMSMVKKLESIAKKDFPTLYKGILYYNHGRNCFNQTKSNNATLIEVGSDINTIEESKNTGKCLAKIIAEYFKNK